MPAAASHLSGPDLIEIWRSDERSEAFYAAGVSCLSREDAAEIATSTHPVLRDRAMRCRILLRYALSHRVDNCVAPRDWRFNRSERGRLALHGTFPALDFSISHSGTLSAIAVAHDRLVGLDLEAECNKVDPLEMGDYLHPREARDLVSLPPAERRAAFFRLWVLKEAYSKFLGTGFATNFASIAFAFETARLIETPIGRYGLERTQFSALRLADITVVHHVALAVGNRSA